VDARISVCTLFRIWLRPLAGLPVLAPRSLARPAGSSAGARALPSARGSSRGNGRSETDVLLLVEDE
jgi:hypothetical protein